MNVLNNRWKGLAAVTVLACTGIASAAESGLIGIKLFDSGVRVVTVYGSPDSIEAVNVGGMGSGGPGGMGGPGMGAPGMGGPGSPTGGPSGPIGGGPGRAGGAPSLSFGDYVFNQMRPGGQGTAGMPGAAGAGAPGGPPMGGAPGAGGPPMGGRGGPGGAPGGGGGAATNATFTRWIYNRSGSKYGFVIDNKGRVVQIEAMGLSNARVKTAQGISFGATFAQVIKKYQTPDGYDISGDNVFARFLNRSKVAFRFSRISPNKPQVVTGIVVAAGKG